MTSAGQDRQLPSDARRHGGGQGANHQLRTIPAAGAKAISTGAIALASKLTWER
jgi:hypothetical protein